jgi:hypothetical protein
LLSISKTLFLMGSGLFLAAIEFAALVVPTIADAVDFRFSDPTNLSHSFSAICAKRGHAGIDNAEHLLDGWSVYRDLEPVRSKTAVTSRERLNLLSEWVFEVQGCRFRPTNR